MNFKMILYIYKNFSPFVKKDFLILNKKYELLKFRYNSSKKLMMNILSQTKLFFWILKNIFKSEVIYIWFAGYHSLLPVIFAKILNKKSIVVLGGHDVANIPELGYGNFINPVRTLFTKYSIKLADFNICVSINIESDALNKVPSANTEVIYTGYSKGKFPFNKGQRENIVLTVAACKSKNRLIIKGINYFLKYASYLPQYKFIIIGNNIVERYFSITKNVTIIGYMSHKELIRYYQKAKVYAQFSLREGLPNAVCEAMLCGCIPVGFNNGGIPIAIGNSGYILDNSDINHVNKTITKAMKSTFVMRQNARQRIIQKFNIQKRKTQLYRLINN